MLTPYSPETTFEGYTYRVKCHTPDHRGYRKWELQLKLKNHWSREAITSLPGTATWQDAYKKFGIEVPPAKP